MGKGNLGYKNWVAMCLCGFLLLLTFGSSQAKTTIPNTFHKKGAVNWYSSMATAVGVGRIDNQSRGEVQVEMPNQARQSLPAATNTGWQDIAMAVLAAGILVSISAVGLAVWRIKD